MDEVADYLDYDQVLELHLHVDRLHLLLEDVALEVLQHLDELQEAVEVGGELAGIGAVVRDLREAEYRRHRHGRDHLQQQL